MQNRLQFLCFSFLIFFWGSCIDHKKKQPDQSSDKYQIKTSANLRLASFEDIEFEVFYKDFEYLKKNQINNAKRNNLHTTENDELPTMIQFSFRIWLKQFQNQNEVQGGNLYNEKLKYMAGPMQKDFKLVINKDTLSCLAYHHESNGYKDGNHLFQIGFDTVGHAFINEKISMQLIFDDHITGKGLIKFDY